MPPSVFLGPFLVVLLTRLPFIGFDYGVEPDAWRVAAAASRMAQTGVYSASRIGHNPIHDIGAVLLFGGDVWAVTIAAAVAVAVASGTLALMVWRIRGEQAALLGVAMAFVPVVYIASTGGTEDPWTLAALVLATWTALEDRPVQSGLAFGVAVGCRLSVMPLGLVPLLLILGRGRPERGGQLLKFLAVTTGTILLAYTPVFLRYGLEFIAASWAPPRPIQGEFRNGLLETWGPIGLFGVVLALVSGLVWRRPPPIFTTRTATAAKAWRWTAWLLGVTIPLALFVRFPSHAGYLIPAVPFVLLIGAERLTPQMARILSVCLIASPFLLNVRARNVAEPVEPAAGRTVGAARIEYLRGPIIYDQARRKARYRTMQRVIGELPTLPDGATVVVGGWRPMLTVLGLEGEEDRLRLKYDLSVQDLTETSTDTQYFVLPGVLRRLETRRGIDVSTKTHPLPSSRP